MTTPNSDAASMSDRLIAQVDQLSEDRIARNAEIQRLRRTLRAVNDNALGWHAGEDGKARALNVIAVWTSEALAGRIHASVELITEGLDV